MLLNAILITFRQLKRSPGTGLINIFGLAIGITTLTLVLFYIQKETTYDRYHDHPDQLYRIVINYTIGEEQNSTAWTSPALATYVAADLPEITEAVRLFRYRSPCLFIDKLSNKNFMEEHSIWADSNVFRVFNFKFIKGNPNDALMKPNSMVITSSTALKYFGDTDPIGKVLTDLTMGAAFEITGVIEDMPVNSHFKANMLCALNTLPGLWGNQILTNWGNSFLYSYIRLAEGVSPTVVEKKMSALFSKRFPPSQNSSFNFSLQPVPDIHLHSHVLNEWQPNSDVRYIYILTLVGVLILIVSVINYINLWIARAEQRTREIGIRQAIGSSKTQLGLQFGVEGLTQVILALICSGVLLFTLGPIIEEALQEQMLWLQAGRWSIWMTIGTGILVFMVLVLMYPAVIISKVKPVWALKGRVVRTKRGLGLWQGLIGFQIVVTTMLITGGLLIHRQLTYVQETPVGYDARHLLTVSGLSNTPLREQFKDEILQHSHIRAASGVSHVVGGTLYQSGYEIFTGKQKQAVLWQRIHTDHDFCSTYGIPIVAGRDFSYTIASDTSNFIVNETAVRHLGLAAEDALGIEILGENGLRGKIIGVMKDFHFKTLHSSIEPLIIHIVPDRLRMLNVNIDDADHAGTIAWLADKWKSLEPSAPFVYSTIVDFNSRNYAFERKFGVLITYLTLIVFFLSVTGLISLNVYIVNQKQKEIGIRKVLGAGIVTVLIGICRRFAWIVLIGMMLSVPFSVYGLNLWLSGFAYRVSITTGLFVIAGLITFMLSMLSILGPSMRAALRNPVDVLKLE